MNTNEPLKNFTRKDLDEINVGDYVKVNDWKRGMNVKAVSRNFLVMSDGLYYSVVDKRPREAGDHNGMVQGRFHCGKDSWLFGSPLSLQYPELYKFNNKKANKKYLNEFESGKAWISEKHGTAIYNIFLKRIEKADVTKK